MSTTGNVEASPQPAAPTPSSGAAVRSAVFAASMVPLLAAFVAATSLLVDYTRKSAVFCTDVGSGCNAIKHTAYAHPLGIPTPAIGLLGLVALLVFTVLEGKLARTLYLGCAAVGAAVALLLVGVQIKLSHYCVYCMVNDVAVTLLLGFAIARYKWRWELPRIGDGPWLQLGFGLIALGATGGVLYRGFKLQEPPPVVVEPDPPMPEWAQQEVAKTPSGTVAVIDFVDFECPFCRAMHENLHIAAEQSKLPMRFVRKHVPLRMHPHAEGAARACICAEAQNQGDAMADALMATAVEKLEPATYTQLAEKLKLDTAKFAACLPGPETTARIEADKASFKSAGGKGLPLLYIGEQRVAGLADAEDVIGYVKKGKR
jgi:uncharacterized membrane protein/predicted DsbA family dithiol-disulfide isomerase